MKSELLVVVLWTLGGCGGARPGALDGDWTATVLDLKTNEAAPCGGDSTATLSGALALHEDPPGIVSGNVVLCGERSPVLGQVDAAGGFEFSMEDFGLVVRDGHHDGAGSLVGAATTPRGMYSFKARRR